MEIESISDDYYSNGIYPRLNETTVWNGKEIGLLNEEKSSEPSLAKNILANLQVPSSGKSFKITPMSGQVNIAAETDTNGDTSLEIEVSTSSDNGTYEISASGTVDQSGNASGRVEATINWKED